jgi:hypothetical protein
MGNLDMNLLHYIVMKIHQTNDNRSYFDDVYNLKMYQFKEYITETIFSFIKYYNEK